MLAFPTGVNTSILLWKIPLVFSANKLFSPGMRPYAAYSESALCAAVSEGDETAFNERNERHWRNIYLHALTYTHDTQYAEEITQDIFTHLWLKRETLTEVQNFGVWLNVVARNQIISVMRSRLYKTWAAKKTR